MSDKEHIVEGVAGGGGAVLSLLLTYPILTVQTVAATQFKHIQQKKQAEKDSNDEAQVLQQNSIESIRRQQTERKSQKNYISILLKKISSNENIQVIKRLGFFGLYQGVLPAIIGTAISQGVYFYLYSIFKKLIMVFNDRLKQIKNLSREATVSESFIAATLAGCGNVVITSPIWVVATKMQAEDQKALQSERAENTEANGNGCGNGNGKEQYSDDDKFEGGQSQKKRSIMSYSKLVYQQDGWKGFYRGLTPSLIMVSNPTIQYVVFDQLVLLIKQASETQVVSVYQTFLLSAVSKFVATVVTYPILVIKSRLQAGSSGQGGIRYKGTWSTLKRIFQEEGVQGFYKGMSMKIFQSILGAAFLLSFKAQLTDLINYILLLASTSKRQRWMRTKN